MTSSPEIGFEVPGFDWDAYVRFRPAYPDSLFSRIYQYHKQHSDTWAVAHDAGSGAGIAAERLVERFDTVAISDPNQEYVDVAKARLKHLDAKARLIFHRSTAEDQSWLDSESLDMFTIFTAIGYADLDRLMQELSRLLRPGATFTAVNYNGWPAIVDNSGAASAWMDFADVWLTKGILEGSEAAKRGFRVSWAGHDSILIPKETFEDGVLRIKINEEYRPEAGQVKRFPELGFPPSRVRDTDIKVEEENLKEWTRDYTLDELKSFVGTLAYTPGGPDADQLWQRLEQAMQRSQQKTLRLLWTAHVILATRRGHALA
ncbi:MAG: hypothetical protein Q9160_009281 [Pyrenula sp. 1 TL-2023]